ncbi:MAG: hypothetical protein Q9M97_07785 [Candidatus Gracilibacteria bacterium]|nr:hypothetical protein [Candidatus Gracilibacteria bacterium]
MYQGSFNHSACKNSSFSIGFLLYFNILYTKIKFYLIDLRKSLKNASIITENSGLNQRLELENIDLNIIGEDNINYKNIDIVSDNENLYLKGDFGDLEGISEKILSVLKEGKYAKIDNSKPILEIIGNFKNNELIKELIIGMTTSNPEAYYTDNKTMEKSSETLKTDYLINFVFKDGEYNETTKKTSLVFNEKLCTLTPVITKSLGEIYPMFRKELSKEECVEALKGANQFLSFVNIYKEGDSKAGSYKFVINQGSALDISVDYKNHIIDTWALSLSEPTGKIIIRANGNTEKVLSSLVKINIEENGIKAIGEIKDGEGKIVISTEDNSQFELNGFLELAGYRLKSYELNGNTKNGDIKLASKANLEEGELSIIYGKDYNLNINYKDNVYNLDLKSKEVNANGKADKNKLTFNLDAKNYSGKQLAKIDLNADYSSLLKANYDLDANINKLLVLKSNGNLSDKILNIDLTNFRYNGNKDTSINLKSNFNKEEINLNAIEYSYNGDERSKFNFDYNKGKIKGDYTERSKKEYVYVGNFKNLGEFDLKVEFPREDALIKLIGKEENDVYKYNLDVTLKGKEFAKGNAELKIEDKKIISNGNFKSDEEKFEANYNFEFDYREGKAEYVLPTDFKKIDLKLSDLLVLPNFEEIARYDINAGKIIAIVGGIGIGATVIFNQQLEKAKDSVRINNISIFDGALQQYYADNSEYPKKENFIDSIKPYTYKIPKDPINSPSQNFS